METLISDYEKLNAIISNNRNCLIHLPALRQLIKNFNKMHSNNQFEDIDREANLLSHILFLNLSTRFNGMG